MPRVTLSDGRWLEMRPIYVSDRLAVVELDEEVTAKGSKVRAIDYLTRLAAIVDPAVQEKSWSGSVLEMPEAELLGLVGQWRKASEDDAVPPASGTPSQRPSESPASAEPTDSQPE